MPAHPDSLYTSHRPRSPALLFPNVTTSSPASSGPSAGALAGIRVIDLTRVLAGPLCTQVLSDHGAMVIKVESPAGDETRALGPPFTPSGDSAYYTGINRGKRVIGLDLAQPEGRAILERLLEDADVVVENFLPGTMERWGLGCEDLARRFPRLIYCSISGFGVDGPLGGLPGYDAVLQAMGGLMSINGTPESGPLRAAVPVVDMMTGYNAVIGILLSLAERSRSGRGQRVGATLFDTALTTLHPQAMNWLYSGRTPGLLGNRHPNIAPYDKFSARGGELFLGILNDGQFRRFCEHVGRAELPKDPRFDCAPNRLVNQAALRTEIERALADHDLEQLCTELMRIGVPAGRVNTVPEALQQPHAVHRKMVVEVEGQRFLGVPVELSRTPGRPRGPAPTFGTHTIAILEELGYTPGEIESLTRSGAALTAPRKGR